MYNVLLVDDEENTISILLSLIQWQELGVGELYTARDGKCALEIFKQHKIDLMITDIKMPYMDGISLIENVKSLNPNVKCILLTAYSEFEYAKKAIVLRVENYLLKPVIKTELVQTVVNALNSIYENRFSGKEQLRESILRRWIGGSISSEELGERAEILKLNLYLPQYCVICIMKNALQDNTSLLMAYEQRLAVNREVYSFWDERGRFVMIVGGKELEPEKLSQELLQFTLSEGAENKVKISLGEVVYDVAFLHLSYQKACDNMEMLKGNQSCVIWQNDYFATNMKTEFLMEEIRFLMFCNEEDLRRNGYKRLGVKLYQDDPEKDTQKLLTRLWSVCVKVLTMEIPFPVELQNGDFYLYNAAGTELSEAEFLKEVEHILYQAQGVFDRSFTQFSPIVQKACRYVRDSVLNGESCSIKEFCVVNNVNAAYLGHIYKKETG